jgi:hypothetical protein
MTVRLPGHTCTTLTKGHILRLLDIANCGAGPLALLALVNSPSQESRIVFGTAAFNAAEATILAKIEFGERMERSKLRHRLRTLVR